jgi:cell division protein FtsI (penicillin-binding protein 3)
VINDGVFKTPRVAREYRSPSGERTMSLDAGIEERRMTAAAAAMVREVMRAGVMDERASGQRGRPEGYTAAGKTGTARMPKAGGGGYDNHRYFCSFVGYAPAEDPDIVVAVTIIDPKVNRTGGSAAAPIFRKVVEETLPVMGRMPDPELRVAGRASR